MKLNHIRYGLGEPLLLIHGIGGSWRSWVPVLDRLSAHREIIAIDLPGHGGTPRPDGPVTFTRLVDEVADFIERNNLTGIDVVGSSMGARIVLELVRRGGLVGSAVALDPGGFWQGWQRHFFYYSIAASIRLVRVLKPLLPFISRHGITRAILLAQFSAKPSHVPPYIALTELQSFAACTVFDELLRDLAYGTQQEGSGRHTITKNLVIGWGRKDWICFPAQAKKALHLFPDAHLYWFEHCGHFPQWDKPAEAAALTIRTIKKDNVPS